MRSWFWFVSKTKNKNSVSPSAGHALCAHSTQRGARPCRGAPPADGSAPSVSAPVPVAAPAAPAGLLNACGIPKQWGGAVRPTACVPRRSESAARTRATARPSTRPTIRAWRLTRTGARAATPARLRKFCAGGRGRRPRGSPADQLPCPCSATRITGTRSRGRTRHTT